MKVFVVSDMEGVAGIVKWEQTTGGDPMYEEGRRLYTEEINAAVRGARAAGATEIVVMDCHGAGDGWNFNSLVPDLLDPGCEFVVQEHWTEYTEFLEQGCDAALFVGMHAMAGTPRRRHEPHRLRAAVAEPLVQRHAGRRDRDQRRALRALGLSRRCSSPATTPSATRGRELLGDGLTTVAVKQRPRPLQRPPDRAAACPRADRGGRAQGARAT